MSLLRSVLEQSGAGIPSYEVMASSMTKCPLHCTEDTIIRLQTNSLNQCAVQIRPQVKSKAADDSQEDEVVPLKQTPPFMTPSYQLLHTLTLHMSSKHAAIRRGQKDVVLYEVAPPHLSSMLPV